MSRRLPFLLLAALAVAGAGCKVNKIDNPSPVGPSELALSLSLQARPDTIDRDGRSETEIVIQARDENGRPKQVAVRLDIAIMSLMNQPMIRNQFGKLSAYSVLTGTNGQASVIYTAPDPFEDWQEDDLETDEVIILATPVGTDASSQAARRVDIRLVDVVPSSALAR